MINNIGGQAAMFSRLSIILFIAAGIGVVLSVILFIKGELYKIVSYRVKFGRKTHTNKITRTRRKKLADGIVSRTEISKPVKETTVDAVYDDKEVTVPLWKKEKEIEETTALNVKLREMAPLCDHSSDIDGTDETVPLKNVANTRAMFAKGTVTPLQDGEEKTVPLSKKVEEEIDPLGLDDRYIEDESFGKTEPSRKKHKQRASFKVTKDIVIVHTDERIA
jgi:hypothetical protein